MVQYLFLLTVLLMDQELHEVSEMAIHVHSTDHHGTDLQSTDPQCMLLVAVGSKLDSE
jgi:hypothetical protein